MNEQRIAAYYQLIQELLECSNRHLQNRNGSAIAWGKIEIYLGKR